MPNTVLVTGGNRGLGKALVEAYLSVPDTTVIATVRDTAKADAALSPLPKASGSRVLTVYMEMGSFDTIAAGVETLKTTHNITSIDIAIANAGLVGPTLGLANTPSSQLQPFIDVNAYGPFELFRAVLPLLRASTAETKGKFIYVSSGAGSLNGMLNILPIAGYGASKALANYLFKWLALDNKDVIVYSLDPGLVDSDGVREYLEQAKAMGLDMSLFTFSPVDEVARAMQKSIGAATESSSGQFLSKEGTQMPW
ncbi:hypothetical protein COCCADRAFT_39977 [Bipolaris zeicola 26-R-13]|uniref:Ketoreductase (KR) domain-containing protein n=1 Tax=Cochliobolus carbonum (strain 26-R-13) TaxID=930089 RepID=W6XWW1_COCC2|nr:uncharacterized protein COCCADRAFT_39977 [Bipolaris zeicola 26-R-13]EUC29690.1 hypothetical protein COCCADRAFT_39977 [Bipolaris zeicola 26-R-13]